MENPNLVGLLLCGALFLSAVATFAAEPAAPWAPEFIRSKVATTLGGYHATTRGTIRLVFPHENKWLVFRGDPNTYHFSGDGKSWSAAEAAQASRSHLICGNTIYTFYSVLAEPAPKWVFDKFVCRGTIAGKKIEWEAPHKLETEVAYYPDLKQDTKGHFTMTGRHAMRGENGKVVGTEVLWKRSRRPGDFTEWGLDVRCINHLGHRGGPGDTWKRVGSTAHENLVLEGGKSYVIAMMTVDGVGKLYGNLFDGRKWGKEDTELATGMSTWAGTDRRMCAAFDRAYKIIHLAYVDGAGNLSYRSAEAPYEQNDWSKPIRLQSF